MKTITWTIKEEEHKLVELEDGRKTVFGTNYSEFVPTGKFSYRNATAEYSERLHKGLLEKPESFIDIVIK
jgi:hypothetical protein